MPTQPALHASNASLSRAANALQAQWSIAHPSPDTWGCSLHMPSSLFFCGTERVEVLFPWKLFSIAHLNLTLILPSVFWSTARPCTCCRKLPVRWENPEQLSST